MIVISAALVVAAFGLLVAGVTLSQIVLVYVSIGVSALAALLLGAGAFQRRDELLGRASGASTESKQGKAGRTLLPGRKRGEPEPAAVGSSGTAAGGGAVAATAATTTSERSGPADSNIPGDAPVSVLPARGTYHLSSCRQLRRARETAELTYAEAHERGHTACALCMPDTVLAAREGSHSAGSTDSDQATDVPDGAAEDGPGEAATEFPDTAAAPATGTTDDEAGGTVGVPADDDGAYGEAVAAPDDTAEGPEGEAGLVGVVGGSHRYHRLTCAVVEDAVQDGIGMTTLGRSEAETQDCTPCTVCRP